LKQKNEAKEEEKQCQSLHSPSPPSPPSPMNHDAGGKEKKKKRQVGFTGRDK
jgi:hypothetical protein